MSISAEITVKNYTITASECLSWRQHGMSNTEIAHMLGVSPSMARIIARKFRQTGVPDPVLEAEARPGKNYQHRTGTQLANLKHMKKKKERYFHKKLKKEFIIFLSNVCKKKGGVCDGRSRTT